LLVLAQLGNFEMSQTRAMKLWADWGWVAQVLVEVLGEEVA
jgi:hypothetical protein